MDKRNNLKLIIEGVDNVGKTTLINNLIKEFKYNFLLLHYYANPTKEIQWGKDQYNNMFEVFHTNKYVIADRSHIGEWVYPELYHGYDGGYVFDIEKKYNTKDITLIVLIDEPENIIARDDGLSFSTDIEMKKKEINLFKSAFEKSSIENKLLININNLNEEQVLAKVMHRINNKG